jgi:hypothetical protein
MHTAWTKEIDRLRAEVIKAYDDGFLDAINSLERLEEEEFADAIGYLKRVHDELDNEPLSRTRKAEPPYNMREAMEEMKIEEAVKGYRL